jgi:hypothetical protein
VFSIAVPGHGTRLCFLASESAEGQGNMLGMETSLTELMHLLKNGKRARERAREREREK